MSSKEHENHIQDDGTYKLSASLQSLKSADFKNSTNHSRVKSASVLRTSPSQKQDSSSTEQTDYPDYAKPTAKASCEKNGSDCGNRRMSCQPESSKMTPGRKGRRCSSSIYNRRKSLPANVAFLQIPTQQDDAVLSISSVYNKELDALTSPMERIMCTSEKDDFSYFAKREISLEKQSERRKQQTARLATVTHSKSSPRSNNIEGTGHGAKKGISETSNGVNRQRNSSRKMSLSDGDLSRLTIQVDEGFDECGHGDYLPYKQDTPLPRSDPKNLFVFYNTKGECPARQAMIGRGTLDAPSALVKPRFERCCCLLHDRAGKKCAHH